MSSQISIPTQECETQIEVKKSRFIARLHRAQSRADALAYIQRAKIDYPDARHHCWAYRIGPLGGTDSAAGSIGAQLSVTISPCLISLGINSLLKRFDSCAAVGIQECLFFLAQIDVGIQNTADDIRHIFALE